MFEITSKIDPAQMPKIRQFNSLLIAKNLSIQLHGIYHKLS